MRLLHANDAPTSSASPWPGTLYAAAQATRPLQPALDRHIDVEVAIIGGGYTGLSAALHLAEAGRDVAVLEAHRAGWGASGRNGGQLGTGWNLDANGLVERFGAATARALWDFSEGAKALVLALADRHGFAIDFQPGILTAAHGPRQLRALHAEADAVRRHFDYAAIETLTRTQLAERLSSAGHHGGTLDNGAGHLDPLKLALGLADAAVAGGARLFERSEVLRLERRGERHRLVTAGGSLTADRIVLACNGYHDDLSPELGRHVLPINNFIVATEPLGTLADRLLPGRHAVVDTRFIVGYGRIDAANRFVFGGGENTGYRFPHRFADEVHRTLLRSFPILSDARIEYAWGGTLAVTPSRLPWVRDLGDGRLAAGGYSGHGVALAVATGRALARAHLDERDELDLLQRLPAKPFPGGPRWRPALLGAAFLGAGLLDRF